MRSSTPPPGIEDQNAYDGEWHIISVGIREEMFISRRKRPRKRSLHQIKDLSPDACLGLVLELLGHGREAMGESLRLILAESEAQAQLVNTHCIDAIKAQVRHEIAIFVFELLCPHEAQPKTVLAALHAMPDLDMERSL